MKAPASASKKPSGRSSSRSSRRKEGRLPPRSSWPAISVAPGGAGGGSGGVRGRRWRRRRSFGARILLSLRGRGGGGEGLLKAAEEGAEEMETE